MYPQNERVERKHSYNKFEKRHLDKCSYWESIEVKRVGRVGYCELNEQCM